MAQSIMHGYASVLVVHHGEPRLLAALFLWKCNCTLLRIVQALLVAPAGSVFQFSGHVPADVPLVTARLVSRGMLGVNRHSHTCASRLHRWKRVYSSS